MKKIKKIKDQLKELHPDFISRLKKYSKLLDDIEYDYRQAVFTPSPKKIGPPDKAQVDIFEWGNRELKYKNESIMNRRLWKIKSLNAELINIILYADDARSSKKSKDKDQDKDA